MRFTKGKFGIVANIAGVSDPFWWIRDDTGFKVTYLFSAHVHTAPRWPGVKALHLIAGPLRLVLCWQKKKRTWLVPAYAVFALNTFCFQDQLMMGRWGWAVGSLVLMLLTAATIAREER